MASMDVISEPALKAGFARRLRLLRKALGFRFVPAFAEHTGVPTDTLYKYEQGQRLPELGRPELQMILKATGATTDWLVYDNPNSLPTELRTTISDYERRQDPGKDRRRGFS